MNARFILPALLVSLPLRAFAAETDFYSLNQQWTKQNKAPKIAKEDAIEEGFSRAFGPSAGLPGVPSAPTLRQTLQEVSALQAPIELELDQVLLLQELGGLVKFVASEEGIVTLESLDNETLRAVARTIGSTYVHVWTLPAGQAGARGRTTFALRVIPSKQIVTREQVRRRETVEKNRPFLFRYNNGRNASYDGSKFREMTRTNVDFNQGFRLEGDTPHGQVDAGMLTQKDRGKHVLSEAHVTLLDGRVGPFENFNATAGDKRIEPALMVLPSTRVRGAELEHWDPAKRAQWTHFYGREDTSLFGTISPTLLSEKTRDSFLSGNVLEYKVNDQATLKGAYFTGYGQSRTDDVNRQGGGAKSEVRLGEHATVRNEADFDSEKFAQRHAFTSRFEKVRVQSEFRDISKKFFTMTGAPSQQGEVGNRFDVSYTPTPKWAFQGSYDLFRDRLIPNPDDPKRYNQHTDLSVNYYACEEAGYALTFQDLDDTGRLGPTRLRNLGLQYNERFDLWGRRATIFSRYSHRANHFLTSPLSDYRQNQITVGLYAALFWGINFSIQKDWSVLEEVERGVSSNPESLTYTFDTSRQVGHTPFFAELRLRFRDEEETESTSSFMAGEDSAEISGGLTYRQTDDLELFLTGSLTQYLPESLRLTEPRVEAQFFAGMRSNIDTGFRWTTSGDFKGIVFKDANADGVKQEEEPGMPGIRLVSADGKQAVTDEEGRYELKKVSGKKTTISLDESNIPYGFVSTGSISREWAIVPNKTQLADFGLAPRSDITGILFDDLNTDGRFDTGEPYVPNVLVTLDGTRSARTTSSGVYSFTNVVAGPHTVALSVTQLPAGYLPLSALKKDLVLNEGVRYEQHFPLRGKRTVSGRVFADENGDGVLNEKEKALPSVELHLGINKMTTDSAGWYLFDDLAPGNYELRAPGAKPVRVEMPPEPKTIVGLDIAVDKR